MGLGEQRFDALGEILLVYPVDFRGDLQVLTSLRGDPDRRIRRLFR
jgi:hypothetical protein